MAARSPTAFTKYVDQSQFMPRKSILTTEPDKSADDQEFVMDVPRLILSSTWEPIPTTATSRTWLRSIYTPGRDMCGLTSTETCDWAIYAWSDTATNFVVEIQSIGNGAIKSLSVSANHQSKIWRGWVTDPSWITAYTNGTEEEFQIGGYTTGVGGEIVYIAGVAVLSP